MTTARAFIRTTAVLLAAASCWSAVALLLPASDAHGGTQYRYSDAERCLIRKINAARTRRGRARLQPDPQVGYVARRHARRMASAESIWHDEVGRKVTRWLALGQNTGRGGTCRAVFRGFMGSRTHRANILSRWRHIGTGTARAAGKLYVQVVFERRRDPGNIWHYP